MAKHRSNRPGKHRLVREFDIEKLLVQFHSVLFALVLSLEVGLHRAKTRQLQDAAHIKFFDNLTAEFRALPTSLNSRNIYGAL